MPFLSSVLFILIFALSVPTVNARLGETESQCNQRYGQPTKAREIIPGCPTNEYKYHGFRIQTAFLASGGPAIRMVFVKQPGPFLSEDEIAAILKANAPNGMAWKEIQSEMVRKADGVSSLLTGLILSQVGAKSWVRDDGAIADVMLNRVRLTLSLLAAEQLELRGKAEAEAKRKAAIPEF
jgi:hypothetical protein